MAGESLPPNEPQASGDEGPDNEGLGDKNRGQLKNGPKPRLRRYATVFGLKRSKWRDFAGYAILIPWLGYEIADAHSIGKVVLLVLGLTLAITLACSYFHRFRVALTVWLVAELAVGIAAVAALRPEPKPHLELLFTSSESPNSELSLTNDFLMFPSGTRLNTSAMRLGHMSIPLREGHSSAVIRLDLHNDSQMAVDSAEVFIHLDSRLKVEMDTNWTKLRPPPFNDATSFAFRCNDSILPSDGDDAPPIEVFPQSFEPDHLEYACIVQFKAKDIPMKTLMFMVSFPQGPHFIELHVVRASRVGTNQYMVTVPFDFKTNSAESNSFFSR